LQWPWIESGPHRWEAGEQPRRPQNGPEDNNILINVINPKHCQIMIIIIIN